VSASCSPSTTPRAIGATRIRASERGRWLEDSRPQSSTRRHARYSQGRRDRLKICFLVFGSTGSSPVAATKSLDSERFIRKLTRPRAACARGGSPGKQGNRNTPRGRQRQRAHRRGDEPSLKATAGQITAMSVSPSRVHKMSTILPSTAMLIFGSGKTF
jgi:hypothetical protein